ANTDSVVDGEINDEARIEYVRLHFEALSKAIEQGVDVRGYFYWSLMDNYEWNSGYSKRFGIVYVDYATQKRTVKKSGYWYRDFIANQSAR
ncbi:MAG: family 1 glycosylhydrolase, partial [Pseudomonadota bacterium]